MNACCTVLKNLYHNLKQISGQELHWEKWEPSTMKVTHYLKYRPFINHFFQLSSLPSCFRHDIVWKISKSGLTWFWLFQKTRVWKWLLTAWQLPKTVPERHGQDLGWRTVRKASLAKERQKYNGEGCALSIDQDWPAPELKLRYWTGHNTFLAQR